MATPRSIASLTIAFGLVAIPVKLFSATESAEKIAFNLLRRKDGSRVKQQYVAANDGKLVERSEMVKGYEFAKDQYVVFTNEEIKALEEAGSGAIEITEFVPLESVDPVFFDRTYYLAPDRGGAKPYTLLAASLADSKRCAIGKWAARGREHVVVIRAIATGLAMHQLHFQAEVRDIKSVLEGPAQVSAAELKLARQLIDQQATAGFDPKAYVDEFKGRVEAAIQEKVNGKEISLVAAPTAPVGSGNLIDLTQILKASLEARSIDSKARKGPKRVEKSRAPKSARG